MVILIVSVFAAVAAGLVAFETHRNPYLWMLASFFAAFILTSAVHAAVA